MVTTRLKLYQMVVLHVHVIQSADTAQVWWQSRWLFSGRRVFADTELRCQLRHTSVVLGPVLTADNSGMHTNLRVPIANFLYTAHFAKPLTCCCQRER